MKSQLTVPVIVPALCAVLLCAMPVFAAPAPVAPFTPTTNDLTALSRYQLALDQISIGNLGAARMVLEDGIRRLGPQNDLNLLLGYVLQREGRSGDAQNRLIQTPASPLANTFALQLRDAKTLGAAPPFVPVAAPSAAATSAAPAAASPAALAQTDARLAKFEADLIEMVNAERAKIGLKPLVADEKLATVARAHSAEMRDKTYFAHESPTPGLRDPIDRFQIVFNDKPRVIAENIFRSWGQQRQVTINEIREGHESLMKSPGHRANILYPDVTQIGIGIVANGRGDLWITQMFLRP